MLVKRQLFPGPIDWEFEDSFTLTSRGLNCFISVVHKFLNIFNKLLFWVKFHNSFNYYFRRRYLTFLKIYNLYP